MSIKQDRGTAFSIGTVSTTSATATKAAASGAIHFITDISASNNSYTNSGTLAVYAGTTALWVDWIGATGSYRMNFSTPLVGTVGGAISIVANGSASTMVNLSGFTINTL